MKQTQWERAQEVFGEALKVPSADRRWYLEHACEGDSALLNEVESLLSHDIGEDDLEGVFQAAAAMLIDEGSLIGQRVGAYQIRSELGHGGMGAVYLAVRADDEFRKQVAIKVVKRGMDTRAMLERFRYERQILANLDHPYIARLLDGGSTPDHQPYFVMEFVEGRSIDKYCQEEQLSIKDICRLFLRVCEAVTYAHRNLVVHRDLKPSNIIVTPDGAPKLLDFGVAKLMSIDGASDATVTGLFQRPLTPEYASPEQVRGLAVSTATDVYSLGAVLYELLTGSRIHAMGSSTASEWQKVVCEEDIPRPSLRKRDLRGDIDNILLMALRKEPERRYSSVEQLARDVKNFLEGRPVAARQDSFRYRAGKYVRRHRVWIGAAALVIASLVVGVVLTLAEAQDARAARKVAVQEKSLAEARLMQADKARLAAESEHTVAEQQRTIAEQQAGAATTAKGRAEKRLSQMVALANKSLLDVHAAIAHLPGATPARREIIKATLEYLQTLEKDAGADPNLRVALAAAYLRTGEVQGSPTDASLGDTTEAAKSLDRGAEWLKPLLNSPHPDPTVLEVWIDLRRARAQILEATGKEEEATNVLKSLLPYGAILTRAVPLDGREANLHQVLAGTLGGHDPAEAIEHAKLAVEGFTRLVSLDPKDVDAVLALSGTQSLWGGILRSTDSAGAMQHYRESARLREALIAKYPDNSAVRRGLMLVYGQMASVLGDSFSLVKGSDVEGARVYYRKAAAIAYDLAKADPVNRVAQYDVGSVELRLGALDPKPGGEAESVQALEKARGIFEELVRSDPQTVRYYFGLEVSHLYIGNRLRQAGRPEEALASYRKSLSVSEKALSINARDISSINQALAAEQAMASLMADTGDRSGAIEYAKRAVDRVEATTKWSNTPSTRLRMAHAWESLAEVRKRLGDWAEARSAALQAASQWKQFTGADSHAEDLARMERLADECAEHLR